MVSTAEIILANNSYQRVWITKNV